MGCLLLNKDRVDSEVLFSLSLQLSMSSVGDGQALLDLMSNSAMTTGSQSGLRNVTVRKVSGDKGRRCSCGIN